jgi:CRISPR/Cas system-associated endonuclease Cas1
MTKYRDSIARIQRSKRAPLWLPYLREIKHEGKDSFTFIYNGGETTTSLNSISSIMLYGEFGKLDCDIVEQVCRKGIPIVLHRRGMASPVYICTPLRKEQSDTLSQQILARNDGRKCCHIARKLLLAKFYSMKWLIEPPEVPSAISSLKELRGIEAVHSARYWKVFYTKLGYPRQTRRGNGQISGSLNAVSQFLSGIILRWITYHHLSPFHGYLHTASDYAALIYDLIEPYRGVYDRVVFETAASIKDPNSNSALIGMAINAVKDALDQEVYTGLTRQIVTRHELFHGIVLSLKNYLLGNQTAFMIPTIDQPNGGRPRKVCFRLYGRQAGRTDFWKVARDISSSASS